MKILDGFMSDISFNFEMVLLIAVILTFICWVTNKILRKRSNKSTLRRFNASLAGFFPLLLFVLSFRSFAFEPFRIPSSSMMPNLLTGDFIYVDKSAYGLKMPVFHNTIIETGHPKKGDVFVFRSVEDPSVYVIKRVVGVPGDQIEYNHRTKQLRVNGKLIEQSKGLPYTGFHDDINPVGLTQKVEKLGGDEHVVLTSDRVRHRYQHVNLVVPEGHYFGMGDNRDFSKDSRIFGLIPEKNIVGKARFIWMHWRPDNFIEGLKRVGNSL